MKESFSRTSSKEQVQREIRTGLEEYLLQKMEPYGGGHELLAEVFNERSSEKPLSREQFESRVNSFIFRHMDSLVSIMVNREADKHLEKFKILNKDLREYGFGDISVVVESVLKGWKSEVNQIEEEGDGYDEWIYSDKLTDEYGEGKEFNYNMLGGLDPNLKVTFPGVMEDRNHFERLSQYLATAYLKENVRPDTKLAVGAPHAIFAKRYFDKSEKRYLGENDFGMKPYKGEADVENIEPYAAAVQRQVRKVLSNLDDLKVALIGGHASLYADQYRGQSYFKELKERLEQENPIPEDADWDEKNRIRNHINEVLAKEKKRLETEKIMEVLTSPEIESLVVNAVPYPKFLNELGSRRNDEVDLLVEQELGNVGPYDRLKYFKTEEFKQQLEGLLLKDFYSVPELEGRIIATSVAHGRPVIIYDRKQLAEITSFAVNKYIEKTKNEILESEPDENLKKVAMSVDSGRGPNSQYSFETFDLYEAVKTIGVDKFLEMYPEAKATLDKGRKYLDLYMNEFIEGVNSLRQIFGAQFQEMDVDQIKKEMWHVRSLNESYLWNYFAERELGLTKPKFRDGQDWNNFSEEQREYDERIKEYLEQLSQNKRRKLFYEGKQTYWLAKQVQKRIYELSQSRGVQNEHNEYSEDSEGFKFYTYHSFINWNQYDCSEIDLDKLANYLSSHGNIICTFLANESPQNGNRRQVSSNVHVQTVMQIVEAMESGVDMRGVALAYDKKSYVEGVLSGEDHKNDLEYALKDWPAELRKNVLDDEFQIYFENAEQYLRQDPNGVVRYAQLLGEEPELRDLFGTNIERKSDLDLRLCLAVQEKEVRGWYFEGAEYVGHQALQKYFVRFNATREQSGGYPDLHDALFWIPNIKKVEPGEARALLDDSATVDECNELRQFLLRYDKDKDPLKSEGSIKSLRELKKRVFAIEANIDLSTFSPEMIEIISAPGFNLSALKSLQQQERFSDLIEGKLDEEQPFTPHERTFTIRPLNELLSEGLGSYRKKIRGSAQSPKKLFASVKKLMQGREIEGRPMNIQDLLKEIPLDMEEEILTLLQEQRVAVGALVEATVHAKSDPEGWVCGNYTDCCMPFGDSINTDYMFNKGTQYFTVKYNGRIIAQSVVVKSKDNRSGESVIVLDNIEVANNYKNRTAILSHVYKTFWAEYTSSPVKIGTGYSDLIPSNSRLETNKYSPEHSLSYSDARGDQIYDLPKIKGVESLDRVLTFANLTERDTETIVEMEKEAYPEGLIQGKDQALEVIQKQKELEIPGAASSFILRQGNEPAGYLLVLPDKSKLNNEETVVHIYDMVVLPKFQGGKVARKMMERMLDTAKAYNVPAIEFEARESTSYRLITNPRIAKWIESKGFKLAYNEPLPEYLGGEDFYYVRLERTEDLTEEV